MENTNLIVKDNDVTLLTPQAMQQMLGQTIGLTKINAENIAVMAKDLEYVKNIVGGLTNKINTQSDDILNIKDRMSELELNEEITEEQANTIRDTVNKRIAEILHYDNDEMAKYFRTFVIRCYSSLKKQNHMGSSYRRTKKRYYQTVIDTIESWIPNEGIQKLKDKIDKRAEAKRNAMKNGY